MDVTLVCPECGSEPGGDERFCPRCGMPLVIGGAAEIALSERQRRARKIKPQYAQGALVRVAGARNQAEAELIAGLLLGEGIPSLLRRRPGFDVPDFMASGPRDVLVPQSALEAAREMLRPVGGRPPAPTPRVGSSISWPTRLVAVALLAIVLLTIVLFMRTPGTEGASRRALARDPGPSCPSAARCRSRPPAP